MNSMLTLCTGIVRSGSTWSFNVSRLIAQAAGKRMGKPFGSAYFHEQQLETFIERDMQRAPGPTVIKCHGMGPKAMNCVRAGVARAICTYRDPRDCVASDLKFMKMGFDDIIRRVAINLTFLSLYQGSKNTLFIRYEDMMANPLRQVTRIAGHMGVDLSEDELRQIDVSTGIQTSQELCRTLKNRAPSQVLVIDDHRVDPTTHLHENHINGGTVGRWKSELTPTQQQLLTDIFRPWLLDLDYPTTLPEVEREQRPAEREMAFA